MYTQKPSNSEARIDTHLENVEDKRETILLGIDGTADVFDDDYAKSMATSFVKRIVAECPTLHKQYERGPGFDGLDMFVLIDKGYKFVHLNKFRFPDTKVILTGYSRGAAACVGVAKKLKSDGVIVDAMVLFDPVNRSQTSFADDVPNNVLNMVQARRATNGLSRVSFNNCATIWHSPTKCDIRHFWATHGGIGGVPWQPEPDERGTDFVDEGIGEHSLTDVVYSGPAELYSRVFTWSSNFHQPRDYEGSLGNLIRKRQRLGGRTQITFQQDRWGADAVWKWIKPWLLRLGFAKNAK